MGKEICLPQSDGRHKYHGFANYTRASEVRMKEIAERQSHIGA